jgi:site-specific DNA-methyltransferase (cytosine-N4-specific)
MRRGVLAERHVLDVLMEIDWSFTDGVAEPHPLHGVHPYPAKFVPALPRAVVEALTERGDLVVDPFCGSGTALLEALLLGRRAIGGDINPVAIAVARAKTRRLTPNQLLQINAFAKDVQTLVEDRLAEGEPLRLPFAWTPPAGRRFRGLEFWFAPAVAEELAALRDACLRERDPQCRAVYMMCFSSIIVAVSAQDSDTRYVRREKQIDRGHPVKLFRRKLAQAETALRRFAREASASGEVFAEDARSFTYLDDETVALVVTSPPYPNAWSYHLYHQNRILWLDEDPWEFKDSEIGHHRAYSARHGSGADDFLADMAATFAAMRPALRPDATVVVVVGDSIVRGEIVRNDEVTAAAAEVNGLRQLAQFDRVIDPRRKAFNPSIGKIKSEHVLVFAPDD